jgi:dCTP deaminase
MASKKPPALFPEGQVGAGSLTDSEIELAIGRGELIVKGTYVQTSLEASSYDVRVGAKGILGGIGIEINLDKEPMELPPGAYAGVISLERLSLPPNICARIGSKRALSYDGVILLTGALVDPGYEGHLLFGLYNASQRKVMIRHARKICNIVFERLSDAPVRQAPADPDLRTGNFPDAFVDRMANMEVLPWMQISERVKQIEQMTRDILDLKARYEDVLQPIRDLTANVDNLTQDVSKLATQASQVSKDIESVNNLVSENSRQIQQLTANLIVVVGDVKGIERSAQRFEQADQTRLAELTTLKTTFGKFQVLVYIFWAFLLLIAGALLTELIRRLYHTP